LLAEGSVGSFDRRVPALEILSDKFSLFDLFQALIKLSGDLMPLLYFVSEPRL
jgi:hypothetical protein